MRAVIAAQRLCFAATVTADGRPNLSPKGTIRVWDHRHLFFCDIASPGTRRNLQANPWIELNVVDTTSRRGYRFLGTATLHTDDDVYRAATTQIFTEEGATYPVEAVVLVDVKRALPVVSPGYLHVTDEWAMRDVWKRRRRELDVAFDEHIRQQGPLRGSSQPPAAQTSRVACALEPEELRARKAFLMGAIAPQIRERRELPSGIALRFDAAQTPLADLAQVMDLERRCCPFLRFHISAEADAGPVWVEITGPSEAKELIQGLFGDAAATVR